MFNLAIFYADGLGVAKCMKEAVKFYQKAADQNHAGAQYSLGMWYTKGEGLKCAVTNFTLAAMNQ